METAALLPPVRWSLADYAGHGGYEQLHQAYADADWLRRVLGCTDLTGLGGAHFPFAKKLLMCQQEPAPRVVVCNAAEDEPGSMKDRYILQRNPHVLLEGVFIAAAALETREAYLYVSEGSTDALESLDQALSELTDDQKGGVDLRVVRAPDDYVAGEATSAIEFIEGRAARPRKVPPFPTTHGVGGRPTLVSNCETLANLPRVLARSGLDTEPWIMTRLATLTGDVRRPDVYEIEPPNTTFEDLITMAGGLSGGAQLKAIQPGGPSTAFLDASALNVTVTDDAIRAAGSQPGCLAVRIISSDRCIVEELSRITEFFAREQCGQCPACRMKTQNYDKIVTKLSRGGGTWHLLDQFGAVDEFVSDLPAICALIGMPTAPVRSALSLFRDDFERHISGTCSSAPNDEGEGS
ncbi:MAG: NADH-ubiquinone oxidoreductase-F iron-sulfur binding region domain-containing protein [Actinomycetes bacterium]